MDITIRIGNKVVEGVKPSTVKLTINNVDRSRSANVRTHIRQR